MSEPVRDETCNETYEVIWRSGHVEQLQAAQVLWPHGRLFGEPESREQRVLIHGYVGTRWMLLLAVDAADVLSVRCIPPVPVTPRSTQ